MAFRLRPKAASDILSIMQFIAADNEAAALGWQRDIFETFRLLGEVPVWERITLTCAKD